MNKYATINGTKIAVLHGDTILEAAQSAGIEIPTLCHTTGQKPNGGCRLCLVEQEGSSRPVASCHTALQAGAVIETETPTLVELRKEILSFHVGTEGSPAYRSNGHATEFDHLLARYQVEPDLSQKNTTSSAVDDSHPYIRFNADACITCLRCMSACSEQQGQFVFSTAGRGADTHLVFGPGPSFNSSTCVACGACVEVCPTDALSDRDRMPFVEADSTTLSVCGYCGVGCRVEIQTKDNALLRIRGVDDAAVNRGHLCAKGRYAHAYYRSADRLTQPLKKVSGEFIPISWDEAYDFLSSSLIRIRDEHGPDSLGAFTSSRSTNEAGYLLQKLFRTEIGTNNVDCCARVCHASTALALQTVTGTGAASSSYDDIDRATCIVVAGANPTEAHPVVGARIKQAVLRGAKLVVIDPRRIELAEYAHVHLQLEPGSNVALFNTMAKILVESHGVDERALHEQVEGLKDLKRFLAELDLDDALRVAGVDATDVEHAVKMMHDDGPVLFVHGLGLSEMTQGTASVMTLCNLGMLTGSIGKVGAGMLPLRGQNNVQGNADMGSMPNLLTGYQSVEDPSIRHRFEEQWGYEIPATPGITIPEMLHAARARTIRALWIQGEDVVQSDPNELFVHQALASLDFLVVQELFMTQTAMHADLILPAASALEQDGTFTNGERRIQRVRAAVPPPGEARADWEAIRDVGIQMGARWSYPAPADVMTEIAEVAPKLFGGISYDRLSGDGLQWPCAERNDPGTSTVHEDGYLRGKGMLVTINYLASPEHDVADYPYTLVTGRVLEHYNVGTMTRRTPQAELVPGDVLEINPKDARRDGLEDGSTVHLESQWGKIDVPIRYADRIKKGTLFLSFHFPETHTNRLIGPHLDPESKCPQYKSTAVRLAQLG